jgi:hypothetical protein
MLTMSSKLSSRFTTVARASAAPSSLSLPAAFGEQLTTLYGLVQRSHYVFGSPLGPVFADARAFPIPRFVYFGPHASDAALRLAFFAGHDHRDLRGTLALLHLVEQLALKPDLGQGLNLSFFPLVDVLGLAGLTPERRLAAAHWGRTAAPELNLFEKDARLRGYHGFVNIETAPGEDVVTVRLRGVDGGAYASPDLELFSSEDVEPFPVRWEASPAGLAAAGPLTVADDLPLRPFELTLRLPAAWSPELYREATASILKRFVLRYRGFIAYGQHL